MRVSVKILLWAGLAAVLFAFTVSATAQGNHFNKKGNILISDQFNNRILEVTSGGKIVFKYVTNTRPGSVAQPLPTRAVRLANGNTLISDQFNDQVIEIDPSGNIVFSQGMIGVVGNGFNELNAPYDAKVVGDYTGLTPP